MSGYTTKQREEMVRQYVGAGHILIPLKGKVPIQKGWQATEYNPNLTLKDLKGGNFGVVLKDSDLVIDVDPRNFKNGVNSLTELMNAIDVNHFATFMVKTGGGGLHIYMRKPASSMIWRELPRFPGVEFKTRGTQVVGATCIHPDTQLTYDVLPARLSIHQLEALVA